MTPLSDQKNPLIHSVQTPSAPQQLQQTMEEKPPIFPQNTAEKLNKLMRPPEYNQELDQRLLEVQRTLPSPIADQHSNSDPSKFSINHMRLCIQEVNFENKSIAGIVSYDFMCKKKGNKTITLDSNITEIKSVTIDNRQVEFTCKKTPAHKPNALEVVIPDVMNNYGSLSIDFEAKEPEGLFWLPKEKTHTKESPIMYSQAEEIDGANWLPGPHSPQFRLSWEVDICTPKGMMAVVSAQNNFKELQPDGLYKELRMGTKVPLYLLGLAVGPFEYHSYNNYCGIYAERKHANEIGERFKELPRFLEKSGELLARPYQIDWGVYTPVYLPNSYPFGAMEHACATFFGGDSIGLKRRWIHEIAHAWAGNLVTNGTWSEFFFNEGMTKYVEWRICSMCLGDDYASLAAQVDIDGAKLQIQKFKDSGKEDSCRLRVPFKDGELPAITRIPYGKGMLFFMMLDNAIGRSTWDDILKDYIRVFSQSTIDTERFFHFLEAELQHYKIADNFDSFKRQHKLDEWLNGVEIPENAPEIRSSLLDKIDSLVTAALDGKETLKETKEFDPFTMSIFLQKLQGKISKENLIRLDTEYNFTHNSDLLIQAEWAQLCASSHYLTDDTKRMINLFMKERNHQVKNRLLAEALAKTEEGAQFLKEL